MANKEKKGNPIARFFKALGADIVDIGITFRDGGVGTRLSYVILGAGQMMHKQFARGLSLLAIEILFFVYCFSFGNKYLAKITTLGTSLRGFNPDGTVTQGDNSFLILLYGLLTIIFIIGFIFIWRLNIRDNRNADRKIKAGKKLNTNKQDLKSLLDENFDKTLLALPVVGIFIFTVLPIIFMILVSFTNYDYNHQPPSKLFKWVGFDNFVNLFSLGGNGFGKTFGIVLLWTLVWAFFATFLNYFLGIFVAMLINKKGIKFKKLWRTILVMTIAIPQFISLLYVSKMFATDGLVNVLLVKWGVLSQPYAFWAHPMSARILIILINLWVGIPYLMLISTGILMNIPADLYESAKIDGANGWQMFKSITLPYMLFVTGPFLLTQFTGNLNNFNVIYLLSGGGPQGTKLSGGAGYTDLLVTWLYKLVINNTDYKMAAVIGIMVFLVTSIVSVVVYNMLPSVKNEEGFQ